MSESKKPTVSEIRPREQAATEGPWIRVSGLVFQPLVNQEYPNGKVRWCQSLTFEHKSREMPDAEFISHSRTDIPYLLDLVERMGKALEELIDMHITFCDRCTLTILGDGTIEHEDNCPVPRARALLEELK